MSLYRINNPVDLEKQEGLAGLAVLSAMYAEMKTTTRGAGYVHFSNGKQNVFVTTRGTSKEEFVNNLVNICRANGLNASEFLTDYVDGKVDEREVCGKIYDEVMRGYRKLPVETLNEVLQQIDKSVSAYDKVAYDLQVDVNVRNGVKTSAENALESMQKYVADKRMRETLAGGRNLGAEPTRERE